MQKSFRNFTHGADRGLSYECMEAGECETCDYKDCCGAYDDEDFELPDFMIDATNLYRTKKFIVRQQFIFSNCGRWGTQYPLTNYIKGGFQIELRFRLRI